VIDLFEATPSSANFLTAVAFLKASVRLIRAENKRSQLCLQIGLAEENHNHFIHTEVTAVSTTNVLHEGKKSLLWMV